VNCCMAEEKDNFEQRWKSPRAGNPMDKLDIQPRTDDALQKPRDTSIFSRIFGGLLFPGSRKND